ncbi:GAP family protein [Candidatus Collierbacteria bacterium]|nr:GAP family protein [Candidatus Collierbacteria bacterium]
MEICTRVACYLEGKGRLVSFPLVTLAGLSDGINPCAIGMMIMLLGYLVVFHRKEKKQLLVIGLAYILTVFITYLVIGLGFYRFVSEINLWATKSILNKIFGSLMVLAGAVQIKDVFWPDSPLHLRIPVAAKEKLQGLIRKASFPATILLAFLVTLLETPCSLPLYVGTANILSQSGLPLIGVVAYFLYYNFLFVLPLIIILGLILFGYNLTSMKEWEHKAEKWMKLIMGLLLVGMGVWLAIS